MSLIGALNIGKSALATQQASIQVTGNNIANAGNADYTRQTGSLTPTTSQQLRPGIFLGTGVDLSSVSRQIDEALTGRLRGSVSDQSAADTLEQWLGRIESTFNELSDGDLSTQMSTFLNSWSDLANNPQDGGLRQVVIQGGQSLSNAFGNLNRQLVSMEGDVDTRMEALATQADQLASQVADLNGQIVRAEGGAAGQANGLRDQRDAVLKRLSDLAGIKTVPQANGLLDVYVGGEPLVTGTSSRGIYLDRKSVGGELVSTLRIKADNATIRADGGQLGALSAVRNEHLGTVIERVDKLAGTVIFELNRLHSSGQGLEGFSTLTAGNAVNDATVALNDAKGGLAFTATTGSFVVHVTQKATGLSTSTLVQVDLDGLNGDDTTLATLAVQLDGIAGMSASVAGGKLRLRADGQNVEIGFSQDTSGTLAALGINSFFSGHNASDMAVDTAVAGNPNLLAAAKNGNAGDNQTARAIADLEQNAIKGLNGQTLKAGYQSMVNAVAVDADTAKKNAEATKVVADTLSSQREALSGVSLDEEAMNLMRQQRAFQAAARLVSAVDEMMKTIMQMV